MYRMYGPISKPGEFETYCNKICFKQEAFKIKCDYSLSLPWYCVENVVTRYDLPNEFVWWVINHHSNAGGWQV